MFTNEEKKTEVYVRLLEGPEAKVPCPALHIQNDTFEIIENGSLDLEDWSSIWEFFPGDLVRCEKTKIGWLAKELISSRVPDMKIYQLIYLIVESLGEIDFDELKGNQAEIKQLSIRPDIVQKKHPLVQGWFQRNWHKVSSI